MAEQRSDAPRPGDALATKTDRLRGGDIFAAVAASVLSALPVFLVAALALQIREALHFGVASLGLVISLYYLSAAVSSVPLSRFVEAVGALRAMRWGCLATGVLLLLTAAIVRSFASLTAVMVATGVVSAVLQPATNLFLVRRAPPTHHGFAFGVKQAAVPLAVALGGLAVPVIALTVGWRWAFVVTAGLALGISRVMPRSRSSLAAYRAHPPAVAHLGRRGITNLILITFGFALGVAAASALSAFTVTAAAAAGQGKAEAGLLASLGGLVAATTRVAVGIHADRGTRAPLVVAASMLGLGAAAYVMLAVATATAPALLIPAIVLAFSAGWGWNGLFSLAIVSRYPSQAARATAITAVGGRIGGVIGPLVFGIVATHASYAWAWALAAVAAIIGALIILAGRRLLDKTPKMARQRVS
jgi:MFS family permease